MAARGQVAASSFGGAAPDLLGREELWARTLDGSRG